MIPHFEFLNELAFEGVEFPLLLVNAIEEGPKDVCLLGEDSPLVSSPGVKFSLGEVELLLLFFGPAFHCPEAVHVLLVGLVDARAEGVHSRAVVAGRAVLVQRVPVH